ncbi:MAG: site-specific DNA-methyltransferase [Desulfobacterales bacterium]|nr:site-specific DNA-methyltransferase [Desulfobacterales bacterium]MCP4160958.1 site-specific DNA-methyltransferase [Deltaproteobacteria bacterium]
MKTKHKIIYKNAQNMSQIPSESIDLIITSPPYPMVKMWDETFIGLNKKIGEKLINDDGLRSFELMHKELDTVWKESFRVLKKGAFICINIGDATRSLKENFGLYPNHSRITQKLLEIGFTTLPEIIWRKLTNAPNKFMGSGMLPAGAYVTLEHEFILIGRKGGKREFIKEDDKKLRRESSFFWEERNIFFSDIWFDIHGARQKMFNNGSRKRSGAFPFEIPYRLINMYSLKGDTVLDPFIGTGTTMLAAMTACRNSFGFEIDKNIENQFNINDELIELLNSIIEKRIQDHINFVDSYQKDFKHKNIRYNFPVKTKQETDIFVNTIKSIREGETSVKVQYND